jgi:UDP-hydrolysing UDP-N-acetyl-D-glucosamine 2-epimerase
LSQAFDRLASDIVLVVGDRVEAFAAATAGHISGRAVAHIHGGDRALGQVDDSLRHAITKLAHIHFPATRESERRIRRLGEDPWRIHRAGSPGIDQIARQAESSGLPPHRFALLVLHPVDADDSVEAARARIVLKSVQSVAFERLVIVHPNNDPGSTGIARCWDEKAAGNRCNVYRNLGRPRFLGLMKDAAVLIGNSSSGIIEAASFGTPVVNIGPRQLGRERSRNVIDVDYRYGEIRRALLKTWNNGRPRRFSGKNVYSGGAARLIPRVLAEIALDNRLLRKLITY